MCFVCKDLILTRILGLPQSVGIDQRPHKKSRKGFPGALPALTRVQRTGPLPASFLRWASLSLTWAEGKGVSRGQAEGWLRLSAHHSGGFVGRGHAQYPAFAPDILCFELFY